MGNIRSNPNPPVDGGELKESISKADSAAPKKNKTASEPIIQSTLEHEKIQALKEIFNKMKRKPEDRTVSEEEFLVIIFYLFYFNVFAFGILYCLSEGE